MKPVQVLFIIFLILIISNHAKSQQRVKFSRDYRASIQIPDGFKLVYTNPDGNMYAYESASNPVFRIYVSAKPGDFVIPSISHELEVSERIHNLIHNSTSLMEWDERQLITADDRKVKVFWAEYLIFPKGNNAEYKSLDITLYVEQQRYKVSLEYSIDVYQSKISPIVSSILDSFLASGKLTGEKVKLVKENGVYKIPVTINGNLIANFIFDTGASSILISKDFFGRLKSRGDITDDDYIGNDSFVVANGDTAVFPTYLLKSVKVGSRTVYDVSCAVADIDITAMLLGQSFLEKLGSFQINYHSNYLEFK